MFSFYRTSLPIWATAVALCLMGCSDETDETRQELSEVGVDVGVDTDHEMPSVESIDFEASETTDRPSIRVESAQHRAVISETPPLDANSFLSEEMAERIIINTDLGVRSIDGQDVSQTQNAIRYAPKGAEDELFGVGLQIWDLTDKDMEPQQRVDALRDQFLNTRSADDEGAPQGAFTSRRSGIQSLIFAANSEPYVFVLSCDTISCPDWDELYEVGTEIAQR